MGSEADDLEKKILLSQIEYQTKELQKKDQTILRLGNEVDDYKAQHARNMLIYQTAQQSLPELVQKYDGNISPLIDIIISNKDLAYSDSLTGAFSRRFLDERLPKDFRKAQSGKLDALTILMTDVDHFKKVNDTYGHPMGDRILQEVVLIAKKIFGDENPVCRYGGEEFLVPMAKNKDVALASAQRFRKEVKETTRHLPGLKEGITVSVGVNPFARGMTERDLVIHADMALYKAKEAGRDGVFYYDSGSSTYIRAPETE